MTSFCVFPFLNAPDLVRRRRFASLRAAESARFVPPWNGLGSAPLPWNPFQHLGSGGFEHAVVRRGAGRGLISEGWNIRRRAWSLTGAMVSGGEAVPGGEEQGPSGSEGEGFTAVKRTAGYPGA